jgi:biotin carboxylase
MPTTSYRGEAFFEAARRLGVELVAGSDRCHVLAGEWGIPLALDFRDPQGAAQQIVDHARGRRIDAIVPVDDKTTLIAALASSALDLPHNPPEAALAARHKLRMRQALQAAGVPVPRFEAFPIDAAAGTLAARVEASIGFPCVVKPLILSASRGVMRADDGPALEACRRRLAAILAAPEVAAIHGADARTFLVEEFVPGPEFALEGMMSGGSLQVLALFDKPDPLDGPFFEETIYTTPSRHPAPVREQIAACAAAAVAALGLREGPVHAELRLDSRPGGGSPPGSHSLRVIEVAGRSIGGLCSRALRFGVGVTLEELILRQALGSGRELDGVQREGGAAGVMMIPIPRGGVLQEVGGLREARAVPGVESVEITAALEHVLVPLPEGSAYLGFIVARGPSAAQVEESLRRSHACLEFRIASSIPLEKTGHGVSLEGG